MKKKIIIASAVVVALVVAGVLLWYFVFRSSTSESAEGETAIPVSSVAGLTGIGGGVSSQTRFSGLVEPQKTLDIKKDSDKKVSKLFVAQGDTVKKGDKLFQYDTDDIALKLEQTKLEVDTIANKIQTLGNQIEDLYNQRDKATDDEKLGFTLQIQSLELDVKTEEYNKTIKANEAAKIEKSLSNTAVLSEIDGVVKSVNSTGETGQDGQEKPYLSILSTGNYRVKCTVTEMHINSLSQGQAMVVRSRTDPESTWEGTIETIDRDSKAQSNQNGYVAMGPGNGEETQTASKYNFYVALGNYDGLILGQHVFAEIDFGTSTKKEGMWLPAFYVVNEDGKSYVWARNNSEKLEKRQITLGEQDVESDTYEVLEGLAITDYIAFPQEDLKNGMSTVVGGPMTGGNNVGGNVTNGEGGAMMEGEGGAMIEGEGGAMIEGEGGAVIEGEGGAMIEGEGGAVIEGEIQDGDSGAVPAEPKGSDKADTAAATKALSLSSQNGKAVA